MAERTWLEAIVAGVNPQPHNIPKRATFEYTNGLSLTIEGPLINDLWMELIMAVNIFKKIAEGPSPIESEMFRERMKPQLDQKKESKE